MNRSLRAAGAALLLVPALLTRAGTSTASSHPVFGHQRLAENQGAGGVEPSIATDPTTPRRTYVMSGNPDAVWVAEDILSGTDPFAFLTTVSAGIDVEVAVGADGTAYFAGGASMRVRRGGTVEPQQQIPGGGGDRHWIVPAGNGAFFTWVETPDFTQQIVTRIECCDMLGRYQTAEPPEAVTAGQYNRAGQIARGRNDGELYLAYQSVGSVMVARRGDAAPDLAGNQWPVAVAGPSAYVQSFPVTGADRHGRVYVTWSDGEHVYLAVSTNAGESFTVREDVLEPGHSGTFATLAVMPSGAVAVAYFDTPGSVNSAATDPTTEWTVRLATHSRPWDLTDGGWTRTQLSDGVVHTGGLSSKPRLGCGAGHAGLLNGAFADDFEIALTTDGRVVAAYPEDRTAGGCTVDLWVSYQTGGPQLS